MTPMFTLVLTLLTTESSYSQEIEQPASATDHVNKHYHDVIANILVLQFSNPNDLKEVQEVLTKHNLEGGLEVAKDDFAFYNPDNEKYKTNSAPKKVTACLTMACSRRQPPTGWRGCCRAVDKRKNGNRKIYQNN